MPEDNQFGATGQFPEGQLNEHDEGELSFGVMHDAERGVVVVDFGKPVQWIGMPKKMAMELAGILVKHASQLP